MSLGPTLGRPKASAGALAVCESTGLSRVHRCSRLSRGQVSCRLMGNWPSHHWAVLVEDLTRQRRDSWSVIDKTCQSLYCIPHESSSGICSAEHMEHISHSDTLGHNDVTICMSSFGIHRSDPTLLQPKQQACKKQLDTRVDQHCR